MTMSRFLQFFMWSLVQVVVSNGDYIVEVRTLDYSNSANRVLEGNNCCDPPPSNSTNCGKCDTFFFYCLKRVGGTEDCNNGQGSTGIAWDDAPIDFTQDTVLGLPNPLLLPGLTSKWKGVRVYIEAYDKDIEGSRNSFDLINVYEVDIFSNLLTLGVESTSSTYTGLASSTIQLSFKVVCARNYYGPNCSRFCSQDCSCDPGYSGEFCHIRNQSDICTGVNCGANQHCVAGPTTFTCKCNPGFVGDQCNRCGAANCSGHGQCLVMDDNSFTCMCDPGYTGKHCQVEYLFACKEYNITCGGHGRCSNQGSTYMCFCDNGFTGINCTEATFNINMTEELLKWYVIAGAGGGLILVILPVAVVIIVFAGFLKKKKNSRSHQIAQTGSVVNFKTSESHLADDSSGNGHNIDITYSRNVSYGVVGPHIGRNICYGLPSEGPKMNDNASYGLVGIY